MCNLGVTLRLMDLPVQAFECWWNALQLSLVNWDILVGIFRKKKKFIRLTNSGKHAGSVARPNGLQ